MFLSATGLDHKTLNEKLRAAGPVVTIQGCRGQRFIAAGMSGRKIAIEQGVPGNDLGAYLNGASITVFGNAQDAVGDTMNDGEIIVHGNIGDAAGYAMRGGKIFVKGNAGYRAGIHMKEYKDKVPVMVIGGSAGSFLGEYQAGGIIIVLGVTSDKPLVGGFPCTGMHGGRMFLRGDVTDMDFPRQAIAKLATRQDMEEVSGIIREFCNIFGLNAEEVLNAPFTKVVPDSKNPYKQMYVAN